MKSETTTYPKQWLSKLSYTLSLGHEGQPIGDKWSKLLMTNTLLNILPFYRCVIKTGINCSNLIRRDQFFNCLPPKKIFLWSGIYLAVEGGLDNCKASQINSHNSALY